MCNILNIYFYPPKFVKTGVVTVLNIDKKVTDTFNLKVSVTFLPNQLLPFLNYPILFADIIILVKYEKYVETN